MITTIETRLKINENQIRLIDSSINLLSHYFRKSWVMFNNKKLSETHIYSFLSKTEDLTSCEIISIINKVKTEHSKLKELTKTQKKQLEHKIAHIEQFIKLEKAKIKKNNTEIDKLKIKNQINYSKINQLVNYNKKKSFVIENKNIKLKRLKKKLYIVNKRIESNIFKLCFGSSLLLRQRPGHYTDKFRLIDTQNPYSELKDWERDWDLGRNNVWYVVGKADKPQGNAEIQYYANEKTLRLRLPDKIAFARMEEMANEINVNLQDLLSLRKYGSQRVFCKFIEINNIEFNQRFIDRYLVALQNKQPITAKVVKKLTYNKQIGYYLQLSFEEKNSLKITNKHKRVLGIDLNQKGLAYSIVKSDGNRLVIDNKAINGFIEWDLNKKSENQRKTIISQTIEKVLILSKQYDITELAIENLDFSHSISEMNSGYRFNSQYNKILTQFAKAQFKAFVVRKCDRLGLKVNLVNPSYSSVGGFIKYGIQNKCPVDISASHWLARQALFGEVYKKEYNANYVKKYQEVISFPYMIQSKQSKRLNFNELEWKDISSALGKNRKLWISQSYNLLRSLNVAQAELELESNPFQT